MAGFTDSSSTTKASTLWPRHVNGSATSVATQSSTRFLTFARTRAPPTQADNFKECQTSHSRAEASHSWYLYDLCACVVAAAHKSNP